LDVIPGRAIYRPDQTTIDEVNKLRSSKTWSFIGAHDIKNMIPNRHKRLMTTREERVEAGIISSRIIDDAIANGSIIIATDGSFHRRPRDIGPHEVFHETTGSFLVYHSSLIEPEIHHVVLTADIPISHSFHAEWGTTLQLLQYVDPFSFQQRFNTNDIIGITDAQSLMALLNARPDKRKSGAMCVAHAFNKCQGWGNASWIWTPSHVPTTHWIMGMVDRAATEAHYMDIPPTTIHLSYRDIRITGGTCGSPWVEAIRRLPVAGILLTLFMRAIINNIITDKDTQDAFEASGNSTSTLSRTASNLLHNETVARFFPAALITVLHKEITELEASGTPTDPRRV
jgi:hypothetical protein